MEMEFANVYPNILVILTKVVDQSVLLAANVQETKHVSETNVKILVLELVDKMQIAMLSITSQLALVHRT